jgi:hypothetical protein
VSIPAAPDAPAKRVHRPDRRAHDKIRHDSGAHQLEQHADLNSPKLPPSAKTKAVLWLAWDIIYPFLSALFQMLSKFGLPFSR